MRDIKFRIWDTENKEMLKVQELDFEPTFYGGRIAIRPDQYNDYFDTEDMILMQYTGLKDKNGKEIYEGDIVRQVSYKYSNDEYGHKGFYENISKVLYKGRAFQYEWIRTNGIEMPKDFKESFIEVIGNIYDNPDLLEKGTEE